MLMAHEEEFRVKPGSAAQMYACMIDVHLMLYEFAGGAMTRLFSSVLFVLQNARRLSYARCEPTTSVWIYPVR